MLHVIQRVHISELMGSSYLCLSVPHKSGYISSCVLYFRKQNTSKRKKMILSFLLSTDLNHTIVLISSLYGKKITEILQFLSQQLINF